MATRSRQCNKTNPYWTKERVTLNPDSTHCHPNLQISTRRNQTGNRTKARNHHTNDIPILLTKLRPKKNDQRQTLTTHITTPPNTNPPMSLYTHISSQEKKATVTIDYRTQTQFGASLPAHQTKLTSASKLPKAPTWSASPTQLTMLRVLDLNLWVLVCLLYDAFCQHSRGNCSKTKITHIVEWDFPEISISHSTNTPKS